MKTPSRPFGVWVTDLRSDLFTWARIKLSALYLLIIAVILLLFTFSIFASFTDRLNDRLHDSARQAPPQHLQPQARDDESSFSAEERSTYDRALDDIKQVTLYADLAIFVIAGFLSYVLAGYTLRPIKDALDAQLAFSADASHELRTPLSVLRTNTELMLRDLDRMHTAEMDDIRRMLLVNLSEIVSMGKMSNELLALARGQHETRSSFKKVHLDDVVRSVTESLRALAEQKGLTLRYEKLTPATVNGDEHALRRMVQNILANAISYTPSGTITVSVHADAKQVDLKIVDTGIGIPQSDLPHIFDRFYKADHARSDNDTGSGLGLAIVHQIVRAHGGTIGIESDPGTTVQVVLPCA